MGWKTGEPEVASKREGQAREAAWMPLAQQPVQSAYESQAPAARFLEQPSEHDLGPDPDRDEPLLCFLRFRARHSEAAAPQEFARLAHAEAQSPAAAPRE